MRKLDIFDLLFINVFFGIIVNSFWVLSEIILLGKRNPNLIDSVVYIFFMFLINFIFVCFGKIEVGFYIPNKFLFSFWDSERKIMFKFNKFETEKIISFRFLKIGLYIYKRKEVS